MPTYQTAPYQVEFSRDLVVLDTNVLVAAFLPTDSKHSDAKTFLDLVEGELIVPIAVAIETWNMLVGSFKNWNAGFDFLVWLSNPGNAVLIPQPINHYGLIVETTQRMHIDCVDAILLYLANEVSEQCDLRPSIKIATYDTSDFAKCLVKYRLRINLLDPNTLDLYELG